MSLFARLNAALPGEGILDRARLGVSRLRGEGAGAEAGRMALAAFSVRVASAVIAYASQVLLARWMGASEYGIFVAVWVWVVVLGAAATLGLNISIMRFMVEHAERREPNLLRGVLLGSRLFAVLFATALAALGVAGLALLGDRVTGHFVAPLYLALFCLPLYALTEVQDGMARPYNWIGLALAPPYIWRPLLILALMTAAHLAGLEANATNAMMAVVAATWVTGLLQLAVIERRLAARIAPVTRAYDFRRWIGVSLPIFAADIFRALLLNVDVFVLSFLVPAAEVGVYFATTKTLSLISFVSFATATAATHKFAAYHAAGDRPALEAMVRGAASWTFWPSLAAAALMLAAGQPLLSLFGPDFVEGYPLMAILVVGLLARSAAGPLDQLLNMLGHETACARIYAAVFATCLALNLALVPLFGVVGAASSMAAAMMLEAVLLLVVVKRRTGIGLSLLSALRPPAALRPRAATL